jgi:SAM-dependent methyltransferase
LTTLRRPAWEWNELKGAGPEHLDRSYVAGFDRKSAFDPEPDLADLRSQGLGPRSTLLDFGAGTGEFAIAASRRCKHVVAIDVSPPMVALMREKLARHQIRNVDVVQAGFLTYEHRGERAGFAYSKNALHHLPDFWKAIALRRIADALAPEGVLMLRDLVYSFAPEDRVDAIERWLDDAPSNPSEGWTRPELEAHVREEFSTYSFLLEAMLARAGFAIRAVEHSDSKIFARYTCTRNAAPERNSTGRNTMTAPRS